jgi:hypothetical protein
LIENAVYDIYTVPGGPFWSEHKSTTYTILQYDRCLLYPQEITALLPFSRLSLDDFPESSEIGGDLSDYIQHRVIVSPEIATNVTTPNGTVPDPLLLSKFNTHLASRSQGSFLYLKLTLDLFQRAHLVLKGGNYMVVPVSLAEVKELIYFIWQIFDKCEINVGHLICAWDTSP